ncbi:class I SAM-dependent methyltransferase [Amycolatopsis sp. RTGN1]|uniref:class I SAM-dependent methyltransferase n=1 Tax=Amycolatopsis ponsaeliensis TaxID=2992142 RepID=UPI00254B358F|nr:methyltransferase domain-containing protein [Amycolatopsis sp. RTGN1]
MSLGRMLMHGGERADGALITRPRLYELASRVALAGRERRYRELVRLAGVRPGERVLDVGCGSGYLAALAAEAGGSVLGVDASEPMIEFAGRTRGSATCRFEVGTAQALPADDGEFDVVLTSLVLHHLPDADQPAALTEMHRVLRPAGRLLLADFRPPESRVMRHLVGTVSGPRMLDDPHARLAGLAVGAGFTVTGQGRLGFLAYVAAAK